MRLFVRSLLVASAAVLVPAAAQAQQTIKLAYVNSQLILSQAPGRAEAEATYEREANGYRSQVQRMGDSLNTLVQAYDKEVVTLSPAAKDTRQKAIRDKEAEYQRRAQELEQRMNQRQAELVQPIMDRVQQALNDIRTEEGYTIIFDVASSSPAIVSADKNLDITDKVLARLRTMGTATSARPNTTAPAAAGAQPKPAGAARPGRP
jgi:outer membrane protein